MSWHGLEAQIQTRRYCTRTNTNPRLHRVLVDWPRCLGAIVLKSSLLLLLRLRGRQVQWQVDSQQDMAQCKPNALCRQDIKIYPLRCLDADMDAELLSQAQLMLGCCSMLLL